MAAVMTVGGWEAGTIAQRQQRDLRQLAPFVAPSRQHAPANEPAVQRQAEPEQAPEKEPSPPKQDLTLDDMEA